MTDLLERPSRRSVLAGTGALVVGFSLAARGFAQEAAPVAAPPPPARLPGALNDARFLDAWIRVDASGAVTVFTGKAELGQGIRTALLQVAAEELEIEPGTISLVTADTERTPNEGYTAGSQSMQNSATAIRNAAAQVREILVGEAATRLGVPAEDLRAEGGYVLGPDGKRLGYGEIVSDTLLHVEAQPKSKLKDPKSFKVIGKSFPRVDIPGKVTGGAAFVQDMRLPGMLHARVIRPPSPGGRLASVDTAAVEKLPGVVKVVRDGSFLAVVAEREWQAIKAMRALARAARWDERPTMPDPARLFPTMEGAVTQDGTVKQEGSSEVAGAKVLEATFTRPYHMHGSIGPSCAVAQLDGGMMRIWTHTQGVYPDRKAISEMLGMQPAKVHCIQVEGSGCYGHNGADDAAADAALVARAVPGRPVRVQFMRDQEHAWEPYGPAMIGKVRAALDESGTISGWNYELWSTTHSTRPGPAGSLIAARHLATPFPEQEAKLAINPAGNGDRNAIPLYRLPNKSIVWHFIRDMPLRVSALRGLGAYLNVFAIESFMDELAAAAATDPVEFRLKHLDDPRARDVVALTAEKFGWGKKPEGNRGHGFAFAKYKNLAAYCAVACEVEVEPETGRTRMLRAVAATDAGEIVNPDGIRNQIEGGILQALSWTLYEQVAFDETRIKSVDWSSYPILRFSAVPESLEVHLVPRPGAPFLGAGEASQGPAGAAVANAIAAATGKRLRNLPLTREKVKAAIGA